MSMLSALNSAMSGLRTTQAGIDVVSQNVANADSAGYTRRRMTPVQAIAGDRTAGARAGEIERVLDLVAQKQLRLETSGAAYTALTTQFAGQLDTLFGKPGDANSLDGTVNAFTQTLQNLQAEPGNYSARSAVLDAGNALATRISSIADTVQSMRTDAEGRIATGVSRANELLSGIANANGKIVSLGTTGSGAALLDDRDRLINELSQLMDVQSIPGQNGSINLMTTAGQTLVDGTLATTLRFDSHGTLGANSLYSGDPKERSVGTIEAVSTGGAVTDFVANHLIRSGEIAAALEMRDDTLVQAQRQLDELASGLSRALSDRPAPVASAAAGQYDINLDGLKAGNAVTLDYTDGGTSRRVILVPTTGNAPSTIAPGETNDPNAVVIPFNIKGGVDSATAIGDINKGLAAAGINITVSSSAAAKTLRFQGSAPSTVVAEVSAGITVDTLASGEPQLPFFVDKGYTNTPFTGSFEGRSHLVGFAQRIGINPSLQADRSKLVVYSTSPATPQGDTTRPEFLVKSLTEASRTFAAASGVGGVSAPYTSTLTDFARRVVETHGANAETAQRLNEGQKVALSTIQSRFAESAGVNIDQEMTQLVQLQSAYGANARVMTAVRDMLDMLLRI